MYGDPFGHVTSVSALNINLRWSVYVGYLTLDKVCIKPHPIIIMYVCHVILSGLPVGKEQERRRREWTRPQGKCVLRWIPSITGPQKW